MIRSSAIFYFKQGAGWRTTISFMNYWRLKRELEVSVFASVRDESGALVRRERLSFDAGQVVDYAPTIPGRPEAEGSVEIEVFCLNNMRIPYAAVMAVYETARGVSMVHSYARTYSPHEIEEGRTIARGEESCWTLRDDARFRSFGVFHNGGHAQPAQSVELAVRNAQGRVRRAAIALGELKPYALVKIVPSEHIDGLASFLDGKIGNASISYVVQDAFTRMLVGNEARDGGDCQITHSNFNYSRHKTDAVDGKAEAYMEAPALGGRRREVLVYPDSDSGRYHVSGEGKSVAFATGEAVRLPLSSGPQRLVFRKDGDSLPTRIVTALILEQPVEGLLPAECSLGVATTLRPPKRLWWGLCAADAGLDSLLVVHPFAALYGDVAAGTSLHVRLYGSRRQDFLETKLGAEALPRLGDGAPLTELFPGAREFLAGGLGWYTLYSDYPGFSSYTLLVKKSGGYCLEHGF